MGVDRSRRLAGNARIRDRRGRRLDDRSISVRSDLLGPHFELDRGGAAREAWELIEADGSQEMLGFGTVADGAWMTGRFRSDRTFSAPTSSSTGAARHVRHGS